MVGAKRNRWSRVVHHQTGQGLIIPVDHGLTSGPISGMESSDSLVRCLSHPAVSAVVAHKGMLERLAMSGCLLGKGMILQMNGMMSLATQPNRKELLATVDTALRLGADALSVDLVFDSVNDAHNLALLGSVVDQAAPYGLPVLVMAKYFHAGGNTSSEVTIGGMRRVIRAAWELGADAVKIPRPDAIADIPVLLKGLSSDIDVFFAGGARSTDEETLELLSAGLAAGAKGLCVGRNVFQNPHPEHLLGALSARYAQHAVA